MFRAHQLHLPDEVRLFQYLAPPIYDGEDALVFDGQASPSMSTYARSYLFRQRWLEIFVTFDAELRLLPDPDDPFPFVCNCDLTTPYLVRGTDGYTIDLFLDVLVAADGRTYQIRDREEFEEAATTGSIPLSWYQAVQRDLAWLINLLDTNQFLPMLQHMAAFPTQHPHTALSTLERYAQPATAFPDLRTHAFATTDLVPDWPTASPTTGTKQSMRPFGG